jgi:hypothetical protein
VAGAAAAAAGAAAATSALRPAVSASKPGEEGCSWSCCCAVGHVVQKSLEPQAAVTPERY